MIKNIILDMGNVLLDYNPDVCLDHFLEKKEEKDIIKKELFEGREWVDADLGNITEAELYDRVKLRVPEYLHPALKNCTLHWSMCMKPIKGAEEFCKYAKEKGYKLYVLSNASASFYDYFPSFLPLAFFDGVVVSSDIHIIKPDQKIYEYLLERYRLTAKECFFIDDRADNIEAAKAVGMEGMVFQGDYEAVKGVL